MAKIELELKFSECQPDPGEGIRCNTCLFQKPNVIHPTCDAKTLFSVQRDKLVKRYEDDSGQKIETCEIYINQQLENNNHQRPRPKNPIDIIDLA